MEKIRTNKDGVPDPGDVRTAVTESLSHLNRIHGFLPARLATYVSSATGKLGLCLMAIDVWEAEVRLAGKKEKDDG